jgi:glucose/arabinose dehydrogenase
LYSPRKARVTLGLVFGWATPSIGTGANATCDSNGERGLQALTFDPGFATNRYVYLHNNRAIWARGLRNPFKFAVQPATGTIFINDVGEKAWEEINQLKKEANYGWPVHEGVANDPPYVNPIFAYGHGGDPATTGCSITGGAFYNPTTTLFPPEYEGGHFFAEFCGGWIRSLDPATGKASGFASGLERPVDLEVSKNGELYYLARGSTGSQALVGKIGYAGN